MNQNSEYNLVDSVGLANCGNQCYLSSALQMLYSINEIRNFILNYKNDNTNSDENIVFSSIKEIFGHIEECKLVSDCEYINAAILEPLYFNIYNRMTFKKEKFKETLQDSQAVLDTILEFFKKNYKNNIYNLYSINLKKECECYRPSNHNNNKSSIIKYYNKYISSEDESTYIQINQDDIANNISIYFIENEDERDLSDTCKFRLIKNIYPSRKNIINYRRGNNGEIIKYKNEEQTIMQRPIKKGYKSIYYSNYSIHDSNKYIIIKISRNYNNNYETVFENIKINHEIFLNKIKYKLLSCILGNRAHYIYQTFKKSKTHKIYDDRSVKNNMSRSFNFNNNATTLLYYKVNSIPAETNSNKQQSEQEKQLEQQQLEKQQLEQQQLEQQPPPKKTAPQKPPKKQPPPLLQQTSNQNQSQNQISKQTSLDPYQNTSQEQQEQEKQEKQQESPQQTSSKASSPSPPQPQSQKSSKEPLQQTSSKESSTSPPQPQSQKSSKEPLQQTSSKESSTSPPQPPSQISSKEPLQQTSSKESSTSPPQPPSQQQTNQLNKNSINIRTYYTLNFNSS